MPPVIEIKALTKFYRAQRGIEDLSLSVAQGQIYGFVGPNGAGKTTTIRLLLGFMRPTSGSVRLFDEPSGPGTLSHRARLGYLPGELGLPERMTGRGALNFYAKVSHSPAPLRPWLCEKLALDDSILRRRIGSYSKGTKQKIGIIQALQHDPEVAILDEPTTGLDPFMQQAFFEILKELKSRGRTVFFSTHILSEVRSACDRAAVVRDGRLMLDRPLSGLSEDAGRLLWVRLDSQTHASVPSEQTPEIGPAQFLRHEPNGWLVYEVEAKDSSTILPLLAALRPADFRFEIRSDDMFFGSNFADQ